MSPTRTRDAVFFVPHVADGTVSWEGESWPVVGHIITCPIEIGEMNEWPQATPDQIRAATLGAPAATADVERRNLRRTATQKRQAADEAKGKAALAQRVAAKAEDDAVEAEQAATDASPRNSQGDGDPGDDDKGAKKGKK